MTAVQNLKILSTNHSDRERIDSHGHIVQDK